MEEEIKVKIGSRLSYSKEDLMDLDPTLLRALLRERVHHRIEVPFNAIVSNWDGTPKPNFGKQAQAVLEVWKERDLPQGEEDIQWAEKYCSIANKVQSGEKVNLEVTPPTPFTESELDVVNKLIYERRSIRNWIDRPVPNEMLKSILQAGRAAPVGCNLDEIRFVILKDPEEKQMIRSDISTKNAIIIVVCYDNRIPKVVGQDKIVPHNAGYDAAAAADHMLLMAHALGLGGVWLSKSVESEITEDSGEQFKKKYGLPNHFDVALHIAVGWAERGTIKSKRLPLKRMVIGNEDLMDAL